MKEIRYFSLPVANLHADWPVLEVWLTLDDGEQRRYERALERFDDLSALYREVATDDLPSMPGWPASVEGGPQSLMAGMVLGLQRAAGHQVEFLKPLAPHKDAAVRFVVEHDHADTAIAAVELAIKLFAAWLGERAERMRRVPQLHAEFGRLHAMARETATPADTRALIRAAIGHDIPWYRMDREPFDPILGDFRLRSNGLLRLGHGRHRLTLDGMFCVERMERWHGLARHRPSRLTWLQRSSGLPVCDTDARVCLGSTRVRKTLRAWDGPVWIASTTGSGLLEMAPIPAERLQGVVDEMLGNGAEVMIGRCPAGRRLEVLWIAGQLCGVRSSEGLVSLESERSCPLAAQSLCERLALMLQSDCLSVALIESNGEWRILDFDLDPHLERFATNAAAQERVAALRLGSLYPEGSTARIPIVAITGTNGKTTTCHMVESILRQAGYRTGMASSVGSRVNGQSVSELEDGYLPGHLTVLGHPELDIAVLESTRGGARSVGLGFDHCDVAACLNVAAEHLNDELGLRSVEELAELKHWIALRARRAIVLNFDDPYTREMMARTGGLALTVVSVRHTAQTLASRQPAAAYCSRESISGEDWIAMTDSMGTRPIVRVRDVPMALGGLASYNLSNAAHAVALCAALGVGDDAIAAGLTRFEPGFDQLPGRLNLYQVQDFFVLFDYAHNPHGVQALMSMIDKLPFIGWKRLNFAVSGRRSDDFAREVAALVAGRFDHYLCTNYAAIYHRRPDEMPKLLRAELLAQGVDERQIGIVETANEGIVASLESAKPGDLVVFLVGKTLREQWKLIESFGPVRPVAGLPASAPDASA